MKRLFSKILSVCICVALLLAVFNQMIVSAATAYYNSYTSVASIGNRSSCSAMQGLAVGSTWLYTVKIKEDNSSAVLQKTNKSTGATTNLTDSNGSATYSFLNHANDMDVTTIDGYSQLYIATMATGSNSLVRMKINGSKATKSGSYTIMLNGAQKSVSAVSVESTTDTEVNFLFKVGAQFYRGSVAKSATGGTIDITPAFKINIGSVKINGTTTDLSKYTHQGMGYHNGKIFIPLWGGGASKSNTSVVAVYDITNASGTITSDPNLSFRIISSTYTGFEIESCDISSDNKLYFNANRWNSSSGNYDGVFYFSGYRYKEETNETTQPADPNATYFPACDSSYTTITTALASIGVDNSLAYRKTIAAANGMTDYSGTAEQNTQMLNLLKAGKLIKPSDANPTTVAETTTATEATEITTMETTAPVVTYFPACDSSYTTISTALASIGVDNSLAYRKTIAAANGMTDYSGTVEQNTQMLNLLKAGKLIKPVEQEPTEVTIPTETTTAEITTEPTEVTVPTEATTANTTAEPTEVTVPTETTTASTTIEPTEVTVPTETTTANTTAEPTEVTVPTETTTASTTIEPTEVVETTNPNNYSIGDVNRDGFINITDSTEVQRIIAGRVESTEENNRLADVNFDGYVNIRDATLIQMYCVGRISEFQNPSISETTKPTTEPVTEGTTERITEPVTEATTEPVTEATTNPTTEPVTEPTTEAVKYFPACASSYTTISTGLASIGVDNSFAYRKTIAVANGITNYSGTAEQNTQMLNLLKQGKLIVP